MENSQIKIGITQGDFNGIGYEVIMKSLMDNRINEICIPIVYGSPKVAAYHRKALDLENFSFNSIRSANDAHSKRSNIINCLDDDIRVELGKLTSQAGDAAIRCLKTAVDDLKDGKIDALVTAPIHKKNIQSDGFSFPGHTEFLEDYFQEKGMMLMVSDVLKVGVVTGHIPLREVPSKITEEIIVSKTKLLNRSLIEDFKVRKPRIAVLGLNPHAGDDGVLGSEEIDVIIPAIKQANEEGVMTFGPYAADGFFGSGQFREFDAVLAMFHDQGLSPFKSIVFESGVNFTAGLPVIRTSPVHGTAFEIAGMNKASEDSFRSAIYLALDIHRSRNNWKEISKDPLPSYNISANGKDVSEKDLGD